MTATLLFAVTVPALVAFVLAPALVYVRGRALPEEVVVTRTSRLARKRDDVFALLVDVRAIRRWRKEVRRVEVLASEPRVRYREHGPQGALELEIEEARSPSKLVIRTTSARPMAFEGTWTYELEEDGDETIATLTERGRIRSPFARVFAAYVLGRGTHVARTLAALAARVRRA